MKLISNKMLPNELYVKIFEHLNLKERGRISSSSKTFYQLVHHIQYNQRVYLSTLKDINFKLTNIHLNRLCDEELNLIQKEELTDLKYLRVDWCNISYDGLEQLKGLNQLKSLEIMYSLKSRIFHLNHLINLKHLTIHNAEIEDDDIKKLHLTKLTMISLTFNITEEQLNHILELNQLTSLELYDCSNLTDESLKNISKQRKLKELKLGNHTRRSNDDGLKYFGQLNKLEYLKLIDCWRITDDGFKILSELTELKELIINGNGIYITDSGLEYLKRLKKLVSLDLFRCYDITSDGLKQFKKSMPNVQKIYI